MKSAVVKLNGVTMFFQDYQVRALAGINLEARTGEILAVVGPGRSGKSTLLKIIAGRLRASEGTVRVFGRSPRRSAVKSRIGYLPEPNESSSGNGWFARWFKSKPAAKAPAVEERLGALREAIVGQRDLVVLDEPFAGLSLSNQDEVSNLIRALAARGKTIIFSAVLSDDASHLCDRMAVLYGGSVQALGDLKSLSLDPEAVRIFAPVLGPASAEKVAQVLRSELLRDRPKSPPSAPPPRDASAHDVLSGLTKRQNI